MKDHSSLRGPRGSIDSNSRGFTTLEMLVVILITLMMSAMAISWSSSSRDQVAILTERARIGQLLQRAKSLSLGTFVEASPACGYGVVFINNNYNLIRYRDPVCTSGLAAGGIDESLEGFKLSGGVTFDTGPNQMVRIVFLPPDPKVFMYDIAGNLLSEGAVYLSAPAASMTSTIHVGGRGAIEF